MIDAYEIGIQLLIQDDVSAGLAVINRGLAEVDRGIAATSARLSELVRAAQQSFGVAAITGTAKAASVRSEQHDAIGTDERVESREGALPKLDVSGVPDGTAKRGEPPQAPRETSSAPIASVEVPPIAETRAGDVSAPIAATSPAIVRSTEASPAGEEQPAQSTKGSSVESELAAPRAQESATSATMAPKLPNSQPSAPVQLLPTRSAQPLSVPPRRVPVVASTAQVRTEEVLTARGATPISQASTLAPPPPPLNPSVAPGLGIERTDRGARPGSSALQAQGSPEGTSRERSDISAGTIMLDGRLVGQWLMDHMAESASRPPSGTSFFDSRQTPAWNIAGNM